jgi:hypothetical protein
MCKESIVACFKTLVDQYSPGGIEKPAGNLSHCNMECYRYGDNDFADVVPVLEVSLRSDFTLDGVVS